MNSALLILIAVTSWANAGSRAGGDAGNGGSVVVCSPSALNSLNGMYSVDYVLTMPEAIADDRQLYVPRNWEDSAARIWKILAEKAPYLLESFDDFRESYRNRGNLVSGRIWESAPYGVTTILEQGAVALVPNNCLDRGHFQSVQAIVRQYSDYTGSKLIVYKYVPAVLDGLEVQDPLQLSFLLVHEWLWDLSDNPDRNRRLNRFFHSRGIETMSVVEFDHTLNVLGLPVTMLRRRCSANLYSPLEIRDWCGKK